MTIEERIRKHDVYQKWEPAEGSRLYEEIKAEVEAQAMLEKAEGAFEDHSFNLSQSRATVDSVGWDYTNYQDALEAQAHMALQEKMVEKAQAAQEEWREKLRLAKKTLAMTVDQLETPAKIVANHEWNEKNMAGFFTARDRDRLAKYRGRLKQARAHLLEPA